MRTCLLARELLDGHNLVKLEVLGDSQTLYPDIGETLIAAQQLVDLGFKVRLGAHDISKGDGVTYTIDRIVRHSQYNAASNDVNHPPNMYANDIALIRIVPDANTPRIDPTRIRQIPINHRPLAAGVPVSATGW